MFEFLNVLARAFDLSLNHDGIFLSTLTPETISAADFDVIIILHVSFSSQTLQSQGSFLCEILRILSNSAPHFLHLYVYVGIT
nr:MAG TPA: hypothetical protein [Caudoviricetes sp.]